MLVLRAGWGEQKHLGEPAGLADVTEAGQNCQAVMEAKSWDVTECLGARMERLAVKLVRLFATPGRWGG